MAGAARSAVVDLVSYELRRRNPNLAAPLQCFVSAEWLDENNKHIGEIGNLVCFLILASAETMFERSGFDNANASHCGFD